jgi:excisionase family DNA binding protein
MSTHSSVPTIESSLTAAPVVAPDDQRAGVQALMHLLHRGGSPGEGGATWRLVSPQGEGLELPSSVVGLLEQLITGLGRGDAVAVVPAARELTTQQAARLLSVSRQYMVRLVDEGRIPHRRTGTHRRVHLEDVLAYKRQRDADRMAALDELTRLTQEYGGYGEIAGHD